MYFCDAKNEDGEGWCQLFIHIFESIQRKYQKSLLGFEKKWHKNGLCLTLSVKNKVFAGVKNRRNVSTFILCPYTAASIFKMVCLLLL